MEKVSQLATVLLAAIALHGTSFAAVTAEEADQLGKNLTLWGAEKAGNAAGTIPPYTGGLPPDFWIPSWKKGSGRYEEGPFDKEKPLFSITAANMDKYKENLTPGQMALLQQYPSFRLDIYPTHRSVPWKSRTTSFCKKNALNAKLTANGGGFENAYECVPFPIPKNGYEVLWNFFARPTGGYRSISNYAGYLIPANGNAIPLLVLALDSIHPYHDPNKDTFEGVHVEKRMGAFTAPTNMVGQSLLVWGSADFNKLDWKVWFYTPGQRRVRLAPDISYDTPVGFFYGAGTSDESGGFDGNPDRFDMKLVGKKELYVNYNNHRAFFAPLAKLTEKPFIVNPDLDRWELHRVWVVEATLKQGKRHRDSRRTLYFDEDSFAIMEGNYYDQAGKLYRINFPTMIVLPESQTFSWSRLLLYDLNKREILIANSYNHPESYVKILPDTPADMSRWTASGLEMLGTR